MRLVTFNAWQGQEVEDLRANLLRLVSDTDAPEVLALQEVTRFDGVIPGYARIASDDKGHRDHSSSVLFVRRKGVRILRASLVRVGGHPWQGPHGLMHPPRVYPAASLLVGVQRWRVLDVHRAPLRHINADAWSAEGHAITRYAGDGPRPLVMLGDWQAGPKVLAPLAARTRTDVRVMGVDGALTRNVTGTARKLSDLYGSDAHSPVVLDLTKENPR